MQQTPVASRLHRDLMRLRVHLSELRQQHPPPDYNRYMRSKAWREKREQILSFYGHRCWVCNSTEKLQVHHLHYQSVGAEHMNDVLVCCKRCHFKLHLPQNTDPNWVGSRAVIPSQTRQKAPFKMR